MSSATSAEVLDLSAQVLRDAALEPALLPVLGLLRMQLTRAGLSLGNLQVGEPVHQPAAGYSRREWRQTLLDRSLSEDAPARDIVLVLEFTAEGFTEGSATLLLEERPRDLSSFDWSRRCRSRRLFATRRIEGWAQQPHAVDQVHAAFSEDGLFSLLDTVRADVLSFAEGFQP